MTAPVNMMVGLKDLAQKPGEQPKKMGIVVTSDDLLFDPDDKAMANAVAAAVLQRIKSFLERGMAPDGTAFPPLTGRSVKRRHDEAAQGSRNGQAAPQYTDTKFRARVVDNYNRDYVAPRLGTFTPRPGNVRGIQSGMLLKSFFARPNRDGKGVTIYVAAKRGRPRPTRTDRPAEKRSAIESVFGTVPIMSQALMQTPEVVNAMQKTAEAMIATSPAKLRDAATSLLKELAATAEGIWAIGEAVEE